MLERIEIHDIALIETAVLSPGAGLLILTGETGAGKSILIDAIGALTGSKTNRDMIRFGQDRATIEAVFTDYASAFPPELLDELGISREDDPDTEELLLSREILASGKTVCRINGRVVPLGLLRDVASYLIDIHGQHDQQAIFKTETHLHLLDRYGAQPLADALATWQEIYADYQTCRRKLQALGTDPAERARRTDILDYQIKEIEAAGIYSGEDEKLLLRRRVLANTEKIKLALAESLEMLSGEDETAILNELSRTSSRLDVVTAHLPDLAETAALVRESFYNLQNATDDIRAALDDLEIMPGELEKLDERIDQLTMLKRKYGGTLTSVLQFQQTAQEELAELKDSEALFNGLEKQKVRLGRQLIDQGYLLSRCRQEAAAGLEAHITRELGDLGMKGVRFTVRFAPVQDDPDLAGRHGLDQVEFLISANPGEPMKPLARIASGGEASRIMLAIKSILAEADQIPVLIFDEIDAGVSGHTAEKVAEKLMRLSRTRQIFCITHLAQIAAMADRHILIEKITQSDQTRTRLHLLDHAGRSQEIARLLAGSSGEKEAEILASKLLDQAAVSKSNLV
ncbi:MAG: DNA repair protein RecN [Clostridiaceae bacterium]|nr:DNA repair protein RecN [Clostridiaceae bacterium]